MVIISISHSIFSQCFLVLAVLYYLKPGNGQKVITPIYTEMDLQEGYSREMRLSDFEAREMAAMIVRKNFSISIEFKQREHNQGSLFSVFAGESKVLEVVTDGLKAQLKIRWRRGSTLATRLTSDIDFDDEAWHKVIFELQGPYAQMTKDCEPFLSESFPELEFGLLNVSKPIVWIAQGSATENLLIGKIRLFKIKEGSLIGELCNIKSVIEQNDAAFQDPALLALKQQTDELKQKMHNMENQMAKLTNVIEHISKQLTTFQNNRITDTTSDVQATTAEPDPTRGVCPNCYEYLRHKANYLEVEFKRWRDTIEKLEHNVKRVTLVQRGCLVNNTMYTDGQKWSNNCTQCVCHSGKAQCHPVGCRPLNCSFPINKPGQCCPICGLRCFYMKKFYDHGQTFYPKSCVKCQCSDGETYCNFETKVACPPLSCADNEQVSLENRCCPICVGSNFCSQNPCHKYAQCTNKPHGYECGCLPGFFGDGEKNCFDIDECHLGEVSLPHIDQLSTSSTNENSLAFGMDQSAQNASPCSAGSRCINTPGSFHCECLPGFTKINEKLCFDHIGSAP